MTTRELVETRELKIRLPEKLGFLLNDATTAPRGGRFQVIEGGRGSAKSESVARAKLVRGLARKRKILCAREIQNSLQESVMSLLEYCIDDMKLRDEYVVQKNGIFGANGTEFLMKGLRTNASEIKSMHDIDEVFIEEAARVSAQSMKYLVPTIRNEYDDGTCSSITIVLNAELEEDYIYQNYVLSPPASAIVVRMNWQDNPWFPRVLDAERRELLARAEKAQKLGSERLMNEYKWIWDGACKVAIEGAVYAEEIAQATAEGRIDVVPHLRGVPVDTYWDLGRSDMMTIWFAQRVGGMINVIDYYENSGHHVDHYLEVCQSKPYVYGTFHLPHDARNEYPGQRHTVEKQVKAGGMRRVKIHNAPRSKANGINAGRTIWAVVRVDKDRCSDGLSHMRRYAYGVKEEEGGATKRTSEPLHNEHSHAADGWQTMALANSDVEPAAPKPHEVPVLQGSGIKEGWAR